MQGSTDRSVQIGPTKDRTESAGSGPIGFGPQIPFHIVKIDRFSA